MVRPIGKLQPEYVSIQKPLRYHAEKWIVEGRVKVRHGISIATMWSNAQDSIPLVIAQAYSPAIATPMNVCRLRKTHILNLDPCDVKCVLGDNCVSAEAWIISRDNSSIRDVSG